jgi:hypothetical protein
MNRLVVVLCLVVGSHALVAQSRSSANVIQRGGAPNLTSLLVGLVPAEPIELPGEVDSNSPAVWDLVGGQPAMVVLTSFAGRTRRAVGNLEALTAPMPVRLFPWPGGGVWFEAIVAAPDGTWYGYYHNERAATSCGDGTTKVVPRIGTARSKNRGVTWIDLGVILEAPESTLVCNTNNRYFAGGVGDLSAALDRNGQFLYLFFSEYGRGVADQGVAIARMVWANRDKPSGTFDVWSNGVWLPLHGSKVTDATPIFPTTRLWHDGDYEVDAYWGPTVHWNEYLERYVMLLNRSLDENFDQDGIYVSMSTSLEEPTWSPPAKIFDGGQWYPQVMGLEAGAGTDKLAGQEARFFMSGRSSYIIRFNRAAGLTNTQ